MQRSRRLCDDERSLADVYIGQLTGEEFVLDFILRAITI